MFSALISEMGGVTVDIGVPVRQGSSCRSSRVAKFDFGCDFLGINTGIVRRSLFLEVTTVFNSCKTCVTEP